jgi:hypothetical protein
MGAIVVIAILGGAIYFTPPSRKEPGYHGKTLTKWLKRLDDGQAFGISSSALPSFSPRQIEAAEAVRAIGTNALPLLMEDIHARPSGNSLRFKLRTGLDQVLKRGSRPWWFLRDLIGEETQEDRVRWRAAQGLAALGPMASPAVPELKRLLFTNYWHSSIKEAAYALATIGSEGIAILTNAVQPQEEWSGMCAIWALGQHPEAGTNVIPFLIGATSSTSEGTACGAIQVLGLFHTDAEHVIPALTNALGSANPSVRRDAARALGQFRSPAASAAPLLRVLTNDPAVKANALEALRKIQSLPGR